MTEAELEPPWSRFPELPHGSLGWRMGYGEEYLYRWFDFTRDHWRDQASALAYLRRHPPAPYRWRFFLMSQLDDASHRANPDHPPAPELAREAAGVVLLATVKEHGLLAVDAAYPAFVRNQVVNGDLPPPWRSYGPEKTLRYAARELGWWARWLGTECPDLLAYLDRHPPPPSWASITAQLRAGTSTAWQTLEGGSASLIPAMVQHGMLPPPWTGGHPPLGRDISFEAADDAPQPVARSVAPPGPDTQLADDRDRWMWWVLPTFDDEESWNAYLERWPPTEAWREPLSTPPLRGIGRSR